ncbi:MAG: SCO family protein [Pirellula sp.]
MTNRRIFQVLMILLGIVIGTSGAILRKKYGRSGANRDSVDEALRSSDGEQGYEDPSDQQMEQPRDPGKRLQLAQLLQAAKLEPNWTRSFELTERSGQTVRSEDLLGQPYVVCFFFSTCPGTCKRQSGEMRLLQSKFKDKPIRLVSISVDPDVDTPEALRAYAEGFNADPKQWLFLTGDLEKIIKVGSEMFFLAGVEKRGHPDQFCLVNAQGELVGAYLWKDSTEREQLVKHIEELLADASKP